MRKKVYVQGKACQAQNYGSSWELVQCSYDRLQFYIPKLDKLVCRTWAYGQVTPMSRELLLVRQEEARHERCCFAADGQHLASLGAGIPRLLATNFPQYLPPSPDSWRIWGCCPSTLPLSKHGASSSAPEDRSSLALSITHIPKVRPCCHPRIYPNQEPHELWNPKSGLCCCKALWSLTALPPKRPHCSGCLPSPFYFCTFRWHFPSVPRCLDIHGARDAAAGAWPLAHGRGRVCGEGRARRPPPCPGCGDSGCSSHPRSGSRRQSATCPSREARPPVPAERGFPSPISPSRRPRPARPSPPSRRTPLPAAARASSGRKRGGGSGLPSRDTPFTLPGPAPRAPPPNAGAAQSSAAAAAPPWAGGSGGGAFRSRRRPPASPRRRPGPQCRTRRAARARRTSAPTAAATSRRTGRRRAAEPRRRRAAVPRAAAEPERRRRAAAAERAAERAERRPRAARRPETSRAVSGGPGPAASRGGAGGGGARGGGAGGPAGRGRARREGPCGRVPGAAGARCLGLARLPPAGSPQTPGGAGAARRGIPARWPAKGRGPPGDDAESGGSPGQQGAVAAGGPGARSAGRAHPRRAGSAALAGSGWFGAPLKNPHFIPSRLKMESCFSVSFVCRCTAVGFVRVTCSLRINHFMPPLVGGLDIGSERFR